NWTPEERDRQARYARENPVVGLTNKGTTFKCSEVANERRRNSPKFQAVVKNLRTIQLEKHGLTPELIEQKKLEGLYFCKLHGDWLPLSQFLPEPDEYLCRLCRRLRTHHLSLAWFRGVMAEQKDACGICRQKMAE